jgi:predicted SnoaL-like aldol condensation-catalyzing enzyme
MSSNQPDADQTAHLVRRVLVDGEYVVNHSIVTESGKPRAVRFDLFRTSADDIVEQWHDQEPWQITTANGHTQLDGVTRIDPSADTEQTRQIATAAVQKILVEGDASVLDQHLAGENYVQHNPRFDNGVSGLVQALTTLAEQGITMKYDGIRQVVSDGDFAYIRSEGTFAGDPYVFHDLFRVAAGRCVEHWDVMVPRR